MRGFIRLIPLLWMLGTLIPNQTCAQSPEDIKPALESAILNLHLDEAEKLTATLGDPILQSYYQTRILFLKNVLTDDPQWLSPMLKASENALDLLDDLPDNSPTKNWMEAEVRCLRGATRFIKKQYFGAFTDFRKACDRIYDHSLDFPGDVNAKKLLGVFHVALSSVPAKFQWLSNMLCFKGDFDKGTSLLEAAAKESQYLPGEAQVVLFFLEKSLLDEPEKARDRMEVLVQQQPDNFLYNYLLASAWSSLRENDKALEILKAGLRFKNDPKVFFSSFWYRSLGKASSYTLNYEETERWFSTFVKEYKGNALMADVQFRRAVMLELSGKRANACAVFSQLSDDNPTELDHDSYAGAMAELFADRAMTLAEKELFRARYLFDGGYYELALEHCRKVAELAQTTPETNTEFHYRLGRCYQELDNLPLASHHYQTAMGTDSQRNLWMKVYAHYYLGKIYEHQSNYPQAQQLYLQALEYSGYYYQNGCEQMCKTALSKLNSQTKQ